MFIYSTHRRNEAQGKPKLISWAELRRPAARGRKLGKLKLAGVCALVVLGCLWILRVQRFSFASTPPPLDTSLLVRRDILTTFGSVPVTDPDEFEPDSMDRIEEVVEELKPPAASLTFRDFKMTKYRIRPGDNLWDLARDRGLRTGTLLWANSAQMLDAKSLPVGREILIPNMDAIAVKLKPGESVWDLGRRFSVGPAEIVRFNLLKDARQLKPGAQVYVPNPNLTFQTFAKIGRKLKEGFLWPSSYRVVNSGFGFRIHPIRKRRIFHEGIDIGGGRGSNVFAAADGRVSFVGWMRGYGKIIVIRHKDGITTRYAHLSSTRVSRGQWIEQGQLVGGVGATGLATGPNLHFEVRKNGLPQDPIPYLKLR